MELNIEFKMNECLFLRDPNATELGRRILQHGLAMIYEMGLEEMTFRKLATRIGTTEASIYRYFENKHRLLAYFSAWHWNLMQYQIIFNTKNLEIPAQKVAAVIQILTNETSDSLQMDNAFFDKEQLKTVVIRENPKVYLTKNIKQDVEKRILKPYEDLVHYIGNIFKEYQPNFQYPNSLASLAIETAFRQAFFRKNLPNIEEKDNALFLSNLIMDALR